MSDTRPPSPEPSDAPRDSSVPPPSAPLPEGPNPYVSAAAPHVETSNGQTSNGQTSGLGIAALVVGGVALLLAFVPFVNYVSGLIALVGVVLGIIALIQKDRKKGLPLAGLIVSAVALILSIVLAIVYTAGFVSAVDDTINGDSSAISPSVAPSGEAEPAPEEEEVDPDAVGTRDNPAPLGSTVEFTELGVVTYQVTPGASTLNANDVIAAENEFNEPPAPGMQYAILPIDLTYVGEETGTPFVDLQVSFISADGNTYESYDTSAVTPNDLLNVNELFPGASASGNTAISIPIEGAEQGTWSISALFSEPFYFTAQ